jgi:topoisomerase IA-like protein
LRDHARPVLGRDGKLVAPLADIAVRPALSECLKALRALSELYTRKKEIMATYGRKASEKVEEVMHERKTGTLESGSGEKVTNPKQAIAIALSEARKEGGKVPSPPGKTAAKKPAAKKAVAKKARAKKTAAKKSATPAAKKRAS